MVMRFKTFAIALLAAGFIFASAAIAEDSEPNSVAKRKIKTVTTRDPRTGKITTQKVELTPDGQSIPISEPDQPDADTGTVVTRDPDTSRTGSRQARPSGAGIKETAQQRAEQYQKQLAIPDEQWPSVQPVLTRTLVLQAALNPAENVRKRTPSARTRQPARSEPQDPAAAQIPEVVETPDPAEEQAKALTEAYNALVDAVKNPETPDDQILQSLQAYQYKRQDLEYQFKAARDELRYMLTPRQQAQLTLEGLLN